VSEGKHRRAARSVAPTRIVAAVAIMLAAAVTSVGLSPLPASAAGRVLWNGDFDTGGLPRGSVTGGGSSRSQYRSIQEMGGPGRVRLVSSPRRDGASTRSARIHMPAGSQRSQLVSKLKWKPNSSGSTDRWYGTSLYFGDNWDLSQVTTSSSQFFNPIAWRCQCPNGSLNVDGHSGRLWLRRNTRYRWPDRRGIDLIDLGPIVKGQWIDLVFHIRWSTTTTGALREAWRDGVYMGAKTNRNSVDTSDHYYRVGVYQGTGVTGDRDMWIDNVKIGTSYAAVDPSAAAGARQLTQWAARPGWSTADARGHRPTPPCVRATAARRSVWSTI
jgi:hypothetical protein